MKFFPVNSLHCAPGCDAIAVNSLQLPDRLHVWDLLDILLLFHCLHVLDPLDVEVLLLFHCFDVFDLLDVLLVVLHLRRQCIELTWDP